MILPPQKVQVAVNTFQWQCSTLYLPHINAMKKQF